MTRCANWAGAEQNAYWRPCARRRRLHPSTCLSLSSSGPQLSLSRPLEQQNLHTPEKSLAHQLEQLLAGQAPEGLIENFYFDRSTIACAVNSLAKTAKLYDAIAHHAAPIEHMGRGNQPVVDVETKDRAARRLDVLINRRVPPDMIDIDHHAQIGRCTSPEQVQRLAKCDDNRAISSEHGVEWLYPKLDPMLLGKRKQALQGLTDHGARSSDIPVRGRTAHQHQHVSTQFCRLLDRTKVLFQAGAAFDCAGCWKPTAATETGDGDPGVAHQTGALRYTDFCDLLPPQANRRNAGACAAFNGLAHVPLLCRHLI